jgi:AGZA family xanthine/uracil permease-like MFS transporter
VASYTESAAGVEPGGRTGLTAVFVFISVFFAPIIASIPPWAAGGVFIIVASLLCRGLKDVQWTRVDCAVLAFVTIMPMPLTNSFV